MLETVSWRRQNLSVSFPEGWPGLGWVRKVKGCAGTNALKRNLRWERTEVEGSDGGPGAEGHVTSSLTES